MSEHNKQINDALRTRGIRGQTYNASPQNAAMNGMIRQAANDGQRAVTIDATKPQEAPEQPAVTQDTPQVPTTPAGNAGAGYSDHVTYRRKPAMNDIIHNAHYGNSGGGGAYSETGKQL